MDTISLKPERMVQLEEYAQRHGQDATSALDDALGTYLEWERQDFEEAVAGIRKGIAQVQAGLTRRSEAFAELRREHGLSG